MRIFHVSIPLSKVVQSRINTAFLYKRIFHVLRVALQLSDYKIAKKYNITRQYVHRLRKQLYLELRERYFDIKK